MGNRRRTVQGLLVWKVVPKYNLIYCKGSVCARAPKRPVGLVAAAPTRDLRRRSSLLSRSQQIPGARGCEVRIRDSICRKQEAFKASSPLPFPTILPGDKLFGSDEERCVV